MARPTSADLRELARRTRRLADSAKQLADEVDDRVRRMEAWEAEKTARIEARKAAGDAAGRPS